MEGSTPGLADVLAARRRQGSRVRRTPVLDDPRLDEALGRPVAVKAEFLQRSGSFKFRGLDNSVDSLSPEVASRGTVIVSSGNAGQAAALACAIRGVSCTVVVADNAVPNKIAAIEALGATVVRAGMTAESVFGAAQVLAQTHGLAELHPFDRSDVIAGHGSMALELLEDCLDIGTVVVPAGGGGLLAATAMVVKAVAPEVRVIGVQPESCAALRDSYVAHRWTPLAGAASSIADGLSVEEPGHLTLSMVRSWVDDIVVVSEEEICRAMTLAWQALRVAVEPSAAASIAALQRYRWPGGREVAVATGGNVEPALLAHATSGGTAEQWRQNQTS